MQAMATHRRSPRQTAFARIGSSTNPITSRLGRRPAGKIPIELSRYGTFGLAGAVPSAGAVSVGGDGELLSESPPRIK
jgi:hypothetical protein